jgi:hypothetical protein
MATPAATYTAASVDAVTPETLVPREEFEQLRKQRLEHPIEVRQPLLLISQVQRSGGTLLSQLFDAHPQIHAHPDELHIGYPREKRDWPRLDLRREPREWFDMLREPHVDRSLREGYRKYARKWLQYDDEQLETYPFMIIPSLQRRLFENCVERWGVKRQRDALDAYMTAYFNAWVDNRNLYAGPKRFVTAFSARLAMERPSRDGFFADYPDGRLVSIIREPRSWYSSALAYNADRYGNPELSMRLWRQSADAIVDAKRRHGDKVYVIAFERLLKDTERTMGTLAEYIGIDWHPILAAPTFNGLSIKANSSFRIDRHGVTDAPLKRREGLTPRVEETIERIAADAYERVLELTG